LLVLAALAALVASAAVPSLADGNPLPICDANGCHKPYPPK
jgi:hypothetical protein